MRSQIMSVEGQLFQPSVRTLESNEQVKKFPEIETVVEGIVWAIDMREYMPANWRNQIDTTVEKHAKHHNFPGGLAFTSRAPKDYMTSYDVVTGDFIKHEMPWIIKLYETTFLKKTEEVAGEKLVISENLRAGVNINTINKESQRDGYEDHIDTNLWTVLLTRHTMNEGDGGELIFTRPDSTQVALRVKEGYAYIFDGRAHRHQVKPLINAERRSTIPMNYWRPGEEATRPKDLDTVLYGNESASIPLDNITE